MTQGILQPDGTRCYKGANCQKHDNATAKFNNHYDEWTQSHEQTPMVALLNLITTHLPINNTKPENSWVENGSTFYAFPSNRPQDLFSSGDDIIELEGETPQEQLEDLNRTQTPNPESDFHHQLATLKEHLQNETAIQELNKKSCAYKKATTIPDPNTENWFIDTTEMTKIYAYGNEIDTNPSYKTMNDAEKAIILTQSLNEYAELKVDEYGTEDFNQKTKGAWKLYSDYKKYLNEK